MVHSTFILIALLSFFIQTSQGITEEEYIKKTTEIKSKPEVKKFLEDNEFILSESGVLLESLSNLIAHIGRTENGYETIKQIGNEADIAIQHQQLHETVKILFSAIKNVLTSQEGSQNVLGVASLVKTVLETNNLFRMCLSMLKILVDIFVSKDGLDVLYLLKKSSYDMMQSPLYKIVNNEFPLLLPLPMESANKGTSTDKMKSLLSKISSRTT